MCAHNNSLWSRNLDHHSRNGTEINNNPKSYGKENAAPVIERQSQTYINQKENESERHNGEDQRIEMEVGGTPVKNNRQSVDKKTHRMATQDRKEKERTSEETMAGRHHIIHGYYMAKNCSDENNMEEAEGGLHPALVEIVYKARQGKGN